MSLGALDLLFSHARPQPDREAADDSDTVSDEDSGPRPSCPSTLSPEAISL